jgi:integrase
MFKRTRYQFGSIERKPRKKGSDVWVLRYRESVGNSRMLRSLRIGTLDQLPTEGDAWKAAEAFRLAVNPDKPSDRPMSFGCLIDRYVAEELPERHSTRIAYQSYIRKHIRPKWADYSISQVRAFAVEEWLKRLSLASKSKAHIKSIMRVLFNAAMRWEMIALGENPMRLVRVKNATKRKEEPRILTPEEFHNLLSQILKEPFRTMVLVSMLLGLRASEWAALKWSNVDFGMLRISVERAIVSGRVDEVKTKYSKRLMPVDPALAVVLAAWKQKTVFSQPSDWIFANPQLGGKLPYNPWNAQQRYLRPAAAAIGLGKGIGWHTFRHTYSCLLRQLGVDLKVQQELLRHADVRTTMDVYTQAIPEDLRKANSKVVSFVLPQKPDREGASVPSCSLIETAS